VEEEEEEEEEEEASSRSGSVVLSHVLYTVHKILLRAYAYIFVRTRECVHVCESLSVSLCVYQARQMQGPRTTGH
jgi:hypothetical protein